MAPDHLDDGQSEVVPDPGDVTASMSSAVEHLRRLAATAFTPGPLEIADRETPRMMRWRSEEPARWPWLDRVAEVGAPPNPGPDLGIDLGL